MELTNKMVYALAYQVATKIKLCHWNESDYFYPVKANYHHDLITFATNLVLNCLNKTNQSTVESKAKVNHPNQTLCYRGKTYQVLLYVDRCVAATKFLNPSKHRSIDGYYVVYLEPNNITIKVASEHELFKMHQAKRWLKIKNNHIDQRRYLNLFKNLFDQWYVQLKPAFDQLVPTAMPAPLLLNEPDLIEDPQTDNYNRVEIPVETPKPEVLESPSESSAPKPDLNKKQPSKRAKSPKKAPTTQAAIVTKELNKIIAKHQDLQAGQK